MQTKTKNIEKARFDTKLSKEQKDLFERAAHIGGFRTLTEFIISSVQEKATKIITEKEIFLASKRDKEIFFNAIMHPGKPNAKLKSAAKRYKGIVS